MSEVENLKEQKEQERKIRQKRRIRGVLVIVNALLIAYVGYLVVDSLVDAFKKNSKSTQNDVITLLNKSTTESLNLYSRYVKNSIDVSDVATYGKYLLTSSSHISPASLHVENKNNSITLFKATTSEILDFYNKNLTFKLGDSLDEQLDLFALSSGEYIIYNGLESTSVEQRCSYHYAGEKYFSQTLYSFPSSDGSRKKITIKGIASSPCLVISVVDVSNLPTDYYDFVVYNEKKLESSWLKTLKKNYKVYETSSLVDAYNSNSSYCLNIVDGIEMEISSYVAYQTTKFSLNHSSLIEDGDLKGLDLSNSIRELGGYVFSSGYGASSDGTTLMDEVSKASLLIKNNCEENRLGKFTISVGDDMENGYNNILEVVGLL
jgi:hypothetical protein